MVRNLLHFAHVFDQDRGKVTQEILEERNTAVWRYGMFQSWFCRRYILQVGEHGLNPSYVYGKSLIQFGSSICSYTKRWEGGKVKIGLTSKQIASLVLDHIRLEQPDLLQTFDHLLKQDPSNCQWFAWIGPDFKIFSRDGQQLWTELVDLPEDPIYRAEKVSDYDMDGLEDDEIITLKRPATPPEEGKQFFKRGLVYSNK